MSFATIATSVITGSVAVISSIAATVLIVTTMIVFSYEYYLLSVIM